MQSAILELPKAKYLVCAFLALRRHFTDPIVLKKRATLGLNGRKMSTRPLTDSIIKSFYSKAQAYRRAQKLGIRCRLSLIPPENDPQEPCEPSGDNKFFPKEIRAQAANKG